MRCPGRHTVVTWASLEGYLCGRANLGLRLVLTVGQVWVGITGETACGGPGSAGVCMCRVDCWGGSWGREGRRADSLPVPIRCSFIVSGRALGSNV